MTTKLAQPGWTAAQDLACAVCDQPAILRASRRSNSRRHAAHHPTRITTEAGPKFAHPKPGQPEPVQVITLSARFSSWL